MGASSRPPVCLKVLAEQAEPSCLLPVRLRISTVPSCEGPKECSRPSPLRRGIRVPWIIPSWATE